MLFSIIFSRFYGWVCKSNTFFRYFNKISKKMHCFASFFCFHQWKSNYFEIFDYNSLKCDSALE